MTSDPVNVWDTPLFTLLGMKKPKAGNLGIEIEAESPQTEPNPQLTWHEAAGNAHKKPKYWNVKADGSLRNGCEYVSKSPVRIDKLSEAMDEFKKYTRHTKFREDTIRTSVHYHVNVSDYTLNQILAIVAAWWLVETPVVDTQGKTRVGNLFCLRLADADDLYRLVLDTVQHDPVPFLSGKMEDNVKYAALNLNALHRFGSLEFRFNKGTVDPKEIERWGQFFQDFCSKMADLGSIHRVLELYDVLGTADFFKGYLPKWLLDTFTPDWVYKIQTNYSYVYVLKQAMDSNKIAADTVVREVKPQNIYNDPDNTDEESLNLSDDCVSDVTFDESEMPETIIRSIYARPKYKIPGWLANAQEHLQAIEPDDFPDDDFPDDFQEEHFMVEVPIPEEA